jgi:hypothetical protein
MFWKKVKSLLLYLLLIVCNRNIFIDTGIISNDAQIINIRVRQPLSRTEIQSLQLVRNLDDNDTFNRDLFAAYAEHLGRREHIRTRSINFYKYIRYTFLKDNEEHICVKLHVGEVVMIKEEGGESYAMIKTIFTHKYNDENVYAFIFINWLRDIEHTDTLLRCPIFEKQREADPRWYRIYPISAISNVSKVHFVHACRSSCSEDSHDETNIQYYRNDFFYKTI